MVGYLAFPIGAFILFNHPQFYKFSQEQALESVSRNVNLENLAIMERLTRAEEISKLDRTIDELERK